MSAAGVSASARPLVMSGIASGMPPVPVFVPMPAPVRLNHSSTVNVALRSWVVLPRVAYWLRAVELEGLVGGRSADRQADGHGVRVERAVVGPVGEPVGPV